MILESMLANKAGRDDAQTEGAERYRNRSEVASPPTSKLVETNHPELPASADGSSLKPADSSVDTPKKKRRGTRKNTASKTNPPAIPIAVGVAKDSEEDHGGASIRQVMDSSAGVLGWATYAGRG